MSFCFVSVSTISFIRASRSASSLQTTSLRFSPSMSFCSRLSAYTSRALGTFLTNQDGTAVSESLKSFTVRSCFSL